MLTMWQGNAAAVGQTAPHTRWQHTHTHTQVQQQRPSHTCFNAHCAHCSMPMPCTPPPLQVREMLGLSATGPRKGTLQSANSARGAQPGGGRFLLPLSECEFALDGFLEGLQVRAQPGGPPRKKRGRWCCLPLAVGGTNPCASRVAVCRVY